MDLLRQRAGASRARWWTRSAWGILVAAAVAVGAFGLLELDVVLAEPVEAVVQSCGTDVVDGGLRSPDITYIRCTLLVTDGITTNQESVPLFAAQPAGTAVSLVRTTAFGLQDLRLDDGSGWPALPVAAAMLVAVWWMGFPTPVGTPGRHARRVPGDYYREVRFHAHPDEPVTTKPIDGEVRRLEAVLRGDAGVGNVDSDQRDRAFRRNGPWLGVFGIGFGAAGALVDHHDGVPWLALIPVVSGLGILCLALTERRRHARYHSKS